MFLSRRFGILRAQIFNTSMSTFFISILVVQKLFDFVKFLLNIGISDLRMDSGHNLKSVKPQLMMLVSNVHGTFNISLATIFQFRSWSGFPLVVSRIIRLFTFASSKTNICSRKGSAVFTIILFCVSAFWIGLISKASTPRNYLLAL
jgi:hypothetical protein